MAKEFSAGEWGRIKTLLNKDPSRFGLPSREQGSVLLGSFNIRKLGRKRNRSNQTWEFLANICFRFDLLAVQEVMDNLEGVRHLAKLLGPEFRMIISDKTGAFPGEKGMGERLAFFYRHAIVRRTELATDIAIDRSKLLRTLEENSDQIIKALGDFEKSMQEYGKNLEHFKNGKLKRKPKKPSLKSPAFMTFIRTPFLVSFEIGEPHNKPYKIMAINAHLLFGDTMKERWAEFAALMHWIHGRVTENDRSYYENFILMGDLNLDFDDPETDRPKVREFLKDFDKKRVPGAFVNFPFIVNHPSMNEPFRTNARLKETYDQIAIFGRDKRLPDHTANRKMGQDRVGPDFGVFNLTRLFREALPGKAIDEMTKDERKKFFARFEHEVSDHMPLWLRLPLPE